MLGRAAGSALARAAARKPAANAAATAAARFSARRGLTTSNGQIYNTIMNSNAKYVLFIVTGAAVGEVVYGAIGDGIWRLNNRGKLYDDIDWSKWESLYKDEDEEEEEDEDEE
mmetsp:Transcript_14568/g.36864  ORF Transcript_14568/g.36864 Transcript_14568/m.36864 type:complete len:113 (+) Transcript_14568:104-442(+)